MLNLGSIAGFTPGPYMALVLCQQELRALAFPRRLHQELRRTGVTVTCVAPGPVETEFLDRSGAGQRVLFKILPKLDRGRVAERAWRGFKAGRRLVVPGVSAKLIATLRRHCCLRPSCCR